MGENIRKARNEIPTIDVALVTIETRNGFEFGFETANQIEVEPQTEETDAVKLVVKGRLRAQKPKETTITGHEITLTDNVFIPELVLILQGGTLLYWQDEAKTIMGEEESDYGVAKYTPPVAGSSDKGEVFTLNAYSAIYNAAGIITGYEKTMYPNCQGTPFAFSSEDGTFRAPEYTINSAPDEGEAPYDITWVSKLPNLVDPDAIPVITIPTGELLGMDVSNFGNYSIKEGNIVGTLTKVENFTGFSTDEDEQSGYYIALNVDKWQGSSLRLDRTTGKGKAVSFKDDGNLVVRLGGDQDEVATAKQLVVIVDGEEVKYDIMVVVSV
jgi:hypothetical protein